MPVHLTHNRQSIHESKPPAAGTRSPPSVGRRDFIGIVVAGFAIPALAGRSFAQSAMTNVTWNLADIYPTIADWDAARRTVLDRLPALAVPRPIDRAAVLLDVLRLKSDLGRQAERVETYALLDADADHRVAAAQSRSALSDALAAKMNDAVAWIDPAILALGQTQINDFLHDDPELSSRFSTYVANVLRRQPHIRSAQEETLLAGSAQPFTTFSHVQSQLLSSDIEWPTITLTNGAVLRLDSNGIETLRTSDARSDRDRGFASYYHKLNAFTDVLGANYLGQLEADNFTASARRYPSALAQAMDGDAMPVAVYKQLVDVANDGLPQVHRYMRLRSKLLGLPDLRYSDLFIPLTSQNRKFTLDDMRRLTLEAVQPLGRPYVDRLAMATARNWMDPFPRSGKQVGGYMEPGASYDVHPYILLSLNDDYASLSDYAHEWGHAMHTLLANQAQPYDKAQYTSAISEVPSTLNELLLARYMVENAKSPAEKLGYLGAQISSIWSTFYRQTMLAEFELAVHEKVSSGEGLSGSALSETYLGLLRRYTGPDVTIPDDFGAGWSDVPHLFYNFYVYKYATCIAAAAAFAEQIGRGQKQRDQYLDALRAGGSEHPYDILKKAGVDLANPAPYAAINSLMKYLIDQCEALIT